MAYYPTLKNIISASKRLSSLFEKTPLQLNNELCLRHDARIFLKREDLSPVRSYKLRGAYNKMCQLKKNSVVTCSAGNHAQGVAFSCNKLNIKGDIFMPKITTKQKIDRVKQFGGSQVSIFLEGENFDDSFAIAKKYASETSKEFVHPFDDESVIEGQATVGLELYQQMQMSIDYLFLPVGGGGLAAGVSSYMRHVSPKTKIIGVEPLGAPSMYKSLKQGAIVRLDTINNFVDGASVKQVGALNFPICKKNLDKMILIDEGHVCSKILQMYNESGFIIEPAGVLSLCALDIFADKIKGKTVVSVISGGNSDVFRMPEILERSLAYEGLKHYFKIQFAQKAGSLKNFILKVLGTTDDIIYFRYIRIINKETGPAIIGFQVQHKDDINRIIQTMNDLGIEYKQLDGLEDT
jgi:threonine dehydratase